MSVWVCVCVFVSRVCVLESVGGWRGEWRQSTTDFFGTNIDKNLHHLTLIKLN